jgi:hypothetical protein
MARGVKKIKRWTTISVLLHKVHSLEVYLRCQTQSERTLSTQYTDRYGISSIYGSYLIGFIQHWRSQKIQLHSRHYVNKLYRFKLNVPSNHYARGKVVFENENSDA